MDVTADHLCHERPKALLRGHGHEDTERNHSVGYIRNACGNVRKASHHNGFFFFNGNVGKIEQLNNGSVGFVRNGAEAVDGFLLVLGQSTPIRCETVVSLEHRPCNREQPSCFDFNTKNLSKSIVPVKVSIPACPVKQFLHPHHNMSVMGHEADGSDGDGSCDFHVIRLESLFDEGPISILEFLLRCPVTAEEISHADDMFIIRHKTKQLLQGAPVIGHGKDRLKKSRNHSSKHISNKHDTDNVDDCDGDGERTKF